MFLYNIDFEVNKRQTVNIPVAGRDASVLSAANDAESTAKIGLYGLQFGYNDPYNVMIVTKEIDRDVCTI